MSNLDERLIEAIIYSAKHVGLWDDSLSKAVKKGKTRTLYLNISSLLEGVSKAIADAGYVHSDAKEKADQLVLDMQNVLKKSENTLKELTSARAYVYLDKSQTIAVKVMPGQEWYDRFEKELNQRTQYPSVQLALVKSAAKRAAGLA